MKALGAIVLLTLAACMSAPAMQIASSGSGYLWRTPEQREILWDVGFSPSGDRILTAGYDGSARVWNVATGREERVLQVGTHLQRGSFSPDGSQVIAGGSGFPGDRTKLFDLATGKVLFDWQGGQPEFSTDGRLVFLRHCWNGSGPELIDAWSAETGREADFPAHTSCAHAADCEMHGFRIDAGPYDARLVVTQGAGNRASRVWDRMLRLEVARMNGHCTGGNLSPDARLLAELRAGRLTIWDVQTGRPLCNIERGDARGAVFSPDSTKIAICFADQDALGKDVLVVESRTGSEVARLRGHLAGVRAMAWSPDSRRLVTAGMDRTAILWSIR